MIDIKSMNKEEINKLDFKMRIKHFSKIESRLNELELQQMKKMTIPCDRCGLKMRFVEKVYDDILFFECNGNCTDWYCKEVRI